MKTLITIFILLAGTLSACVKPPENKMNEINWETEFKKQGLVKIDPENFGVFVDLKYATGDNFVGKNVYGSLKDAYIRPEALEKLTAAKAMLEELRPDLRMLIYDIARPRRIQQILWDSTDIPIEERHQYVANPEIGSIHNYGCAVDLTLAAADGTPLDMGTGFDNFTELAHITREEELIKEGKLTVEQYQNRLLLRKIMTEAGFIPNSSEWWHFNAFSRQETTSRFSIVE